MLMKLKPLNIFLLGLIVIGLGFVVTQNLWVPKLVSQILVWEGVQQTRSLNIMTSHVPTNGWLTYDGGLWSIKYPPILAVKIQEVPPKLHQSPIVHFTGLKDKTSISISINPLSNNDYWVSVFAQRDPQYKDILGTILQMQKDSILGDDMVSLVKSEKILINQSTASQFAYKETPISKPSSYTEFTNFNKDGTIANVMVTTSGVSELDTEIQEIYTAMLLTFKFK